MQTQPLSNCVTYNLILPYATYGLTTTWILGKSLGGDYTATDDGSGQDSNVEQDNTLSDDEDFCKFCLLLNH